MASEDVIELGSSDDEAEPAPKKIKPRLNAMVHIPTKLHGVTIKPATSKTCTIKKSPRELVTMTKVRKNNAICNPFSNREKVNGNPQQKASMKPNIKTQRPILLPSKTAINPVNLFKKINNCSQVIVNKIPMLKNPIKIHSPQSLNNLPPSITVKRTTGPLKRPGVSQILNVSGKKRKPNHNVRNSKQVLTVELDDEDSPVASTASPLWYLRPEQQVTVPLEEENNREPEPNKLIEITIEDSPVKPPTTKQMQIVENQIEVTIEDSPVKVVEQTKNSCGHSDKEETLTEDKVPHSKKKLEYPKESKENNIIEIEIEPVTTVVKETNVAKNVVICDIVEIEESPVKEVQQYTSTPKKDHTKLQVEFSASNMQDKIDKENISFHPVYQQFIDLCFQLENSEDMKKIVEKKVKTYYKQVSKDYTESEDFIEMVSSKINAMKAGPEKMYLYIKDIVDELNMQRKMAKSQVSTSANNVPVLLKTEGAEIGETVVDNFLYGEHSEFDSNRQRQIRKLEKTLKKLHRAIQKLEEQEVDFDDEEDSVYLLTERYKERMVRVHAKFCQLTNTKMPSEPRVQIDARPGRPSGPAKRLEKWINKKVPIGTPLPFPDFHDVLRCVREANESDNLGWNEADIMEEARELFTRCGKKLQRRRQENEWRLAASRLSLDIDPAEKDEDLKVKLSQNRQLATKKETEVFNKFADKQNLLKLEPEEIGDKEADESPVESEDEEGEPAYEALLENTNRRKERLKRLLQEKSKKNCENHQEKNPETSMTAIKDKENAPTFPNSDTEKSKDLVSTNQNSVNEELKANDDTNKILTSTVPDNNESKVSVDQKSYSDYENASDSDIDELHLLQKLHSENEVNSSSVESSGSDSPIAISDTLEDSDIIDDSDVISIEDSSYSESEINKTAETSTINSEMRNTVNEMTVQTTTVCNDEKNEPVTGTDKNKLSTNNDEYIESIEDILLASTDDEANMNKEENLENNHCVNLKDDQLSIGDTVIEGIDKDKVTFKGQNHLNIITEENGKSKQVSDEIHCSMQFKEGIVSNRNCDENKLPTIEKTVQRLDQADDYSSEDSVDHTKAITETILEKTEKILIDQANVAEKLNNSNNIAKTTESNAPSKLDLGIVNNVKGDEQNAFEISFETNISNSGECKSVDINISKGFTKILYAKETIDKLKSSTETSELLTSNLVNQQDLNKAETSEHTEVDGHS